MVTVGRKQTGKRANREALQLRDNALAIVAHDLRSPLSTITMAADLLADSETDERRRHFLEMIRTAAAQADALIRDLMDVTRVEIGNLRIERTREPLGYLLQSITGLFEQSAEQAGILLSCDVARVAHIDVDIDHSRFVQMVSNLVSNAIKFTPPGGSVVIDAAPENGNVRMNVRDSGIGISAEELPHVFERFWQADHHHRAGAGLGLAIAKGIAEAHGGAIGVESVEGFGSTFWVTLPAT